MAQRAITEVIEPSGADQGAAGHASLRATIALIIATALQSADATIVNVALPQLERDLGSDISLGAWIMTGYLCASAVMAPLTGWLRRRYGIRRLFPCAIGVFVVASLLCGAATSGGMIILFRVLQGAGGGVIHPLGQAVLLDLYPKHRHGQMLAIWGGAIMVGPILGPAVGGVITDLASWRWVFIINLPLGLLAIWELRRALPKVEALARVPVDGVALVLLVTGIGALQLCLQRGVGHSLSESPELVFELAITAVAFTWMAARTWRVGFPLFRLAVFRDVNFAAAAFYNFTISALLFTAIVFIPAIGEGPLGFDATVAGLTIVPRGVLMMLMMLMTGYLVGRIDLRLLLSVGLLLMAAGLWVLSETRPAHGIEWVISGSTIQAVGAGMLFTPLSTLAFSTVPAPLRTDAAGVYSLLRQLGCASGVAVMTALLQLRMAAEVPVTEAAAAGLPHASDLASFAAYKDCFSLMAAASVLVLPLVFLFRQPHFKAPPPSGI